MKKVEDDLCLLQEDPGGTQHQSNSSREQGREEPEEEVSSSSRTDLSIMSLQSFYETFSEHLRDIPEVHKEFLYNCLCKEDRMFYINDFKPHTIIKIIDKIFLVGTFYKQSCFLFVLELDRISADPGFTPITCELNNQNDPPFTLEKMVFPNMLFGPNCQIPDLSHIDPNTRQKFQDLFRMRKNNRGAIAGIFKDDILIRVFPIATPDYDDDLHLEELVIREAEPYLMKFYKPNSRMEILIYIPNSPCIKRKNKSTVPCFFQLLDKTCDWQEKYNCRTYVGFTDYWGPLSLPELNKVPHSQILSISSVVYPDIESVRFKLNWKTCKKKINNVRMAKINNLKKEGDFKKIQNLTNNFQQFQEQLIKSAQLELNFKEHLNEARRIVFSKFSDNNQICEALCNILDEEIKNNRLEIIKKKLQADFNKKFAEFFLKHRYCFSRNDSFQFCIIDEQQLPTNMSDYGLQGHSVVSTFASQQQDPSPHPVRMTGI